jgi:hypothetical protein
MNRSVSPAYPSWSAPERAGQAGCAASACDGPAAARKAFQGEEVQDYASTLAELPERITDADSDMLLISLIRDLTVCRYQERQWKTGNHASYFSPSAAINAFLPRQTPLPRTEITIRLPPRARERRKQRSCILILAGLIPKPEDHVSTRPSPLVQLLTPPSSRILRILIPPTRPVGSPTTDFLPRVASQISFPNGGRRILCK